jgi:tetracycline resistance efflux pump
MPYALLVAGCCLFGYLVTGFSDGNFLLMLGSSLAALVGLIAIMHFSYQKHAVSLPKKI